MANITRHNFMKGLGVFAAAVALKVKGEPEPEAVEDAPKLAGVPTEIVFNGEYIDAQIGDGDLPLYSSLRAGNEIIHAGSFVYLRKWLCLKNKCE